MSLQMASLDQRSQESHILALPGGGWNQTANALEQGGTIWVTASPHRIAQALLRLQ